MSKIEKKRKQRNQNKGSGNIPGFLQKTYKILENPEYQDIICWTDDGKAFKVKKPNELSEKVLPKYFKHNNFASFVRQLNMYDFHKLRNDSEENEWKHKQFKRGSPHLLFEIKRKIAETPNQELSLVSTNEVEKIKDCQMLGLKNKQEGLEKTCAILIAQNNQILAENKILWSELMKNKEKNNRKMEKLFSIFLSYIGPNFLQNKKPNEMILNEIINQELKEEDNNKFITESDDQLSKVNTLQQICNQYNNKDTEKYLKKLFKSSSIKKQPGKEKKALTFDNFVENYHKSSSELLHNLNSYIQPENQKKRNETQFEFDEMMNSQPTKKIKPNLQQIEYQFSEQENSKTEEEPLNYYKSQLNPMLNYYQENNNNTNNNINNIVVGNGNVANHIPQIHHVNQLAITNTANNSYPDQTTNNEIEVEKKEPELFSPYLLSPKRPNIDVPQLLLSRENSIYEGNHLQSELADKLDWF